MSLHLADSLQETRVFMQKLNVKRPVLLLDKKKTEKNIAAMAEKAKRNNVRFRPHFKTHQSAEIGDWFKPEGTKAITVSSIDMAVYFAENGWEEITIAFPVNVLETEKLETLAGMIRLNLLIESVDAVSVLNNSFSGKADIWLKIDAGYGRTGIKWDNYGKVLSTIRSVENTQNLTFRGLLTHSGNTYHASTVSDVTRYFNEAVVRLNELRDRLRADDAGQVEISVGDTPGCCAVDTFEGVDEVRPGNFVFYDLTAHFLGACKSEEISVCMACPVVAKHPDRKAVVIHGGAVHFSKEFLEIDGKKTFGFASVINNGSFGELLSGISLGSMSQEHGILTVSDNYFENIKIGDMALVFPVHSCLTADLMKRYTTLKGDIIEMGMFF